MSAENGESLRQNTNRKRVNNVPLPSISATYMNVSGSEITIDHVVPPSKSHLFHMPFGRVTEHVLFLSGKFVRARTSNRRDLPCMDAIELCEWSRWKRYKRRKRGLCSIGFIHELKHVIIHKNIVFAKLNVKFVSALIVLAMNKIERQIFPDFVTLCMLHQEYHMLLGHLNGVKKRKKRKKRYDVPIIISLFSIDIYTFANYILFLYKSRFFDSFEEYKHVSIPIGYKSNGNIHSFMNGGSREIII